MTAFGSTYICEQTFSILKFRKNEYCSRLSCEHLNAALRIINIQFEIGYKRISGENSTSKITLKILLHSIIN